MIRHLKHCLLLYGAFAMAACSTHTERAAEESSPCRRVNMSVRANSIEDYNGTSVLIFRKDNGAYRFLSRFSGPWDNEGHATATLELGDYRFLFSRSAGLSTGESSLIEGVTTPEEFGFSARQDANGNTLPVDEIFLPAASEPQTEYRIDDHTTVNSNLTRAVSRIDVLIKRGISDGTSFIEFPYTDGKTVLDHMENLELRIEGTSTRLTTEGTSGSGQTIVRFTPSQATEITAEGFALFTGPLVFPPADNGNVDVKAAFNPESGSPFPEMTGSATSPLQKNKVLELTLWITNDYKFIDITAETRPIEAETEGDNGVWK